MRVATLVHPNRSSQDRALHTDYFSSRFHWECQQQPTQRCSSWRADISGYGHKKRRSNMLMHPSKVREWDHKKACQSTQQENNSTVEGRGWRAEGKLLRGTSSKKRSKGRWRSPSPSAWKPTGARIPNRKKIWADVTTVQLQSHKDFSRRNFLPSQFYWATIYFIRKGYILRKDVNVA